jgi:hypothetical protein
MNTRIENPKPDPFNNRYLNTPPSEIAYQNRIARRVELIGLGFTPRQADQLVAFHQTKTGRFR